jgi:hypothetical protein
MMPKRVFYVFGMISCDSHFYASRNKPTQKEAKLLQIFGSIASKCELDTRMHAWILGSLRTSMDILIHVLYMWKASDIEQEDFQCKN